MLIIQGTHEVGEVRKGCDLVKKWLIFSHLYSKFLVHLRITLVIQFSQEERELCNEPRSVSTIPEQGKRKIENESPAW